MSLYNIIRSKIENFYSYRGWNIFNPEGFFVIEFLCNFTVILDIILLAIYIYRKYQYNKRKNIKEVIRDEDKANDSDKENGEIISKSNNIDKESKNSNNDEDSNDNISDNNNNINNEKDDEKPKEISLKKSKEADDKEEEEEEDDEKEDENENEKEKEKEKEEKQKEEKANEEKINLEKEQKIEDNKNIIFNNANDNNVNKNNENNIINENNQIPSSLSPPPPKMELIKNIIKIIPNFREYEKFSDDILKFEENTGIPDALKNFFRTMKILVKREKTIKRFSKDEINAIALELENYIIFLLYDKLYPTKSSKDDIKFYKKCNRLDFVEPHNIITDKNIINEKLSKTAMEYINKINEKYTPADKIKIISKAFEILQNSITFCSGKKELGVDDTIKPLIYVVLKSKPLNICSNYNYCQLFLNGDLTKKEHGMLITQIGMIINIIKGMKYSDLIGVTEKQFGKDEEI
jgi:hypothetical protein